MTQKGCEWIIHDHNCDLCMTMAGWVDVLDNDWGDSRRWRAIDTSSFGSVTCSFSNRMCLSPMKECRSLVVHKLVLAIKFVGNIEIHTLIPISYPYPNIPIPGRDE